MKIKCDYCDSMIEETEKSCPHCGAPLSGVNRTSSSQPNTIEELQQWYVGHNLPPEDVTRFYIGKDYRGPKAFGIYKNTSGDFVVYKNKGDGSRAIRYQGKDEAYAVNELYQRLRSQIEDQIRRNRYAPQNNDTYQRSDNAGAAYRRFPNTARRSRSGLKGCLGFIFNHKVIAVVAFIVVLFILGVIFGDAIPKGYYNYNGRDYYRQDSKWYYYDNSSDKWFPEDSSSGIYSYIDSDNYSNYSTYSYSGGSLFENSDYYDDYSSSSDSGSWYDSDDDDDWDSDWSWSGSDSWDSDWGGSDWDSDW